MEMNRTIKFRAWDKKEEKFDYDMFVDFEGDVWYYAEINYDTPNTEIDYNNSENRYELMQYTGFKDKNGTEIYEGDIVRLYDIWDELTGGREKGKQRICRVEYVGSGFLVVQGDEEGYERDLFMAKINDDDLEVIGNIYENPELLERSE